MVRENVYYSMYEGFELICACHMSLWVSLNDFYIFSMLIFPADFGGPLLVAFFSLSFLAVIFVQEVKS